MFDEFVGGVDFIHEFRDVHLTLRNVFLVGALQFLIGFLQFFVALFFFFKTSGERVAVRSVFRDAHLGFLIVILQTLLLGFQFVVLSLQFCKLFLTYASGQHEGETRNKKEFDGFHKSYKIWFSVVLMDFASKGL